MLSRVIAKNVGGCFFETQCRLSRFWGPQGSEITTESLFNTYKGSTNAVVVQHPDRKRGAKCVKRDVLIL